MNTANMSSATTYQGLRQRAVRAAELASESITSHDRAQVYAKVAEVYARLAQTEADRELRNSGR